MPSDGSETTFQRVAGLRDRAAGLRAQGQTEEALTVALEARALLADGAEIDGFLLLLIGNCYADLGRYGDADEHLALAAGTFLSGSRHAEYAQAMIGRGRVVAEQGDDNAAIGFFLDLARLDLPVSLRSQVLNNLGALYHRTGNADRAAKYLRSDVELCQDVGDRRGEAIARLNLAAVLLETEDIEAGRHQAALALKTFEDARLHQLAAQAERLLKHSP